MSTFLPPKRYSKYLPTPQKLLKVPSETWDWNLSSYMVPLTVHYISNCRSEAPSATSYTLGPKIYPSPCTLKPNFKAPPPIRHCPSTSCSFSPFACFALSEHSDSSPCSRLTPPPAPPPVCHLLLCLFCSSPLPHLLERVCVPWYVRLSEAYSASCMLRWTSGAHERPPRFPRPPMRKTRSVPSCAWTTFAT